MLRNLLVTAWILHLLEPSAALAQSPQTGQPELHCVVIANQPGRTRDFHYNLRACPADGAACFTKREHHIFRNKGNGSLQGAVACSVQQAPVNFEITFDDSDEDGYQERLEYLKPQAFAWRGLVPNIWCVRNAWFHFTNKRSGAGIAPGYPSKTRRQSCKWEESTDSSLISADIGLPQSVTGGWAVEGKECPGFFDDASRTKNLAWIQTHGIERADDRCWLTGKFNLGSSFTADALCADDGQYRRTSFTFDRIGGNTMRMREGRDRPVTYKRCEKNWLLDPKQNNAAKKLKGQTLSFLLDMDTQMRGVEAGKVFDASQTRKIELRVGDDGTLADRMQVADSVSPKTFKAQLGQMVLDSAGDRATWLIEDGKLQRLRERKGYYEIFSWPLTADGTSVTCDAQMLFAPTRTDGKLRTIGTDNREYNVTKAELKSQRCPKEPLLFAVAQPKREQPPAPAPKPAVSRETLEKCLNSWVDATPDSKKGNFELSIANECKFGIVVVVEGPLLKAPAIRDLPGTVSRLAILRTIPFTTDARSDPKKLTETFQASAITADEYNKSCSEIDIDDSAKALACYDKVNGFASRQSEPSNPPSTSDKIIADACVLATLPKGNEADDYQLILLNKCAFPIVVAAAGWPNGVPFSVLSHLAANRQFNLPGTGTDAKTWNIKLGPKETPAQILKNFAIQAVASDVFEKSCGTEKGDRARMLCFAAIQMKAILAKPASAADKDNSVEKPEPFDISEKPSPKEGNAKTQQQSSSASDADTCIVNKTIGKATPGAKSSHYIAFTNDCPFEPVVAVRGPWLRSRLITPAPSKGSGRSIGYSWGVDLPAGANPDEFLKELEFAALSLENFRRSCDAGVFDTDLELRFECFAGAYDKKLGKRDWSIPLWAKSGMSALEKLDQQATDKCIESSMEKDSGGSVGRYKIVFENTCKYDTVLRVKQPGSRQETAAELPALRGRKLGVTFNKATIDTEAYLKRLEVSVLALEDYERTCGKFRDDDQTAALACFGKVYVARHGEPDWVKDAKTAGGCAAADPDIAIKACTADIAAGKTDADTVNNRAAAYLQKGQFDLALPDLDKALERDPKHFGALINRGIVLMKSKDYGRAIEDFTKAIDLSPMPLRPYRQRAEAYTALGEHAKAWKDADQALKIEPKDDKARAILKAAAHEMFGSKLGDMTEFYADSCSQDKDADLRVKACLMLIKEGKLGAEELALAHVYIGQVAEAISKKDFFANRKEAAQKNIRSALNQYALAMKADMKNPIGYAEIGKVLIAAKKYDHAEQWLRKGEQAAPASRLICDRLVVLYERKGDSAAKDKQKGRCEVLPKDNPFRKINAGNLKSADAKKPEPFDMSEKPSPKDGNVKTEPQPDSAVAADICIKRSMRAAGKNSGVLSISNDCDFDVVGLGWGKGKKQRLKLIVDLPAQPSGAGASTIRDSFNIDLAPGETPDAFLAAMTFQAVKRPAFTDLCGKPNSGWADNELRCFREAHDGKSYQATHGPTQDMKNAEKMCTGEDVDRDQPSNAKESIDACTRLLEFGIIGADGTMDREDTAFLYYYRGTTYGILKQNDKMLADLDKAIELEPDKAQFHYFRAVALAKLNRDSEAIRASNKACEMDKQFCK